MTTILQLQYNNMEQTSSPSSTNGLIEGRTSSKAAIESVLGNSTPQNVLSTSTTTIVVNDGIQTVLPPLSQEKLASTLNNKMEYLSVTGRNLNRRFTRGFYNKSGEMGNMKRLVLTGNKLQGDSRGARLLLSSLPASLHSLNLSWNGLKEEAADVLGRRILHLKELKSICLAGNPIGVKGLRNLIDLGNLHHVEEVDLRQCNLGTAGAKMLAKIISNNEDARVQRVVLDMNLLAAFSKAFEQNNVEMKVQVDRDDNVVFLELQRKTNQ